MTRSSIPASLLAAAALLAAAIPLGAQLDASKPIPIKALKPKLVKFQGEVMHANPVALTARSRENELVIRTFSYSPKVREQMQRILDRGGYQYGDRVEIQHAAGSDVALRIKGKPSKPR
jgi:hypothetical protein